MFRSITLIFIFISLLCHPLFAQESDCVRGEPEQSFNSKNKSIKSVSFKIVSSHEANEEVLFISGDRLTIHDWGCEYFVNTFRYESASMSLKKDPFLLTIQTLRKLAPLKPDLTFNLAKAAKSGDELKIDEEYLVDGDGEDFLQAKLTVKGMGKLPNGNGGYIEFQLSRGPL